MLFCYAEEERIYDTVTSQAIITDSARARRPSCILAHAFIEWAGPTRARSAVSPAKILAVQSERSSHVIMYGEDHCTHAQCV